MKPPKCKICGKEHALGPCPAEAVATAIVDALLPPPRSRQKPEATKPAKPKLQVVEGAAPSEKLAKAREIMAEIEAKPTRRKAKKPNKIIEGLQEAVSVAKGEAKPARVHRVRVARTPPTADELTETQRRIEAKNAAEAARLKAEFKPEPQPDRPKPARKGNRHSPGYMAEYMRKRRAAAKEGKK